MPANVDPLSLAIDEHFRCAPGTSRTLSVKFDFVQILRVQGRRVPVHLHFRLGEFQTHKLAAFGCEILGTCEDFLAVFPLDQIIGSIGEISPARHRLLLERLANYLVSEPDLA